MRAKGILLATIICAALFVGTDHYAAIAQPDGQAAPEPAPQPAPPEAGPQPAPRPNPAEDEALRESIQKGLDYLARVQTAEGAIGEQNRLAATSLAGMAFLSGGNFPGRGKYCKNVEMAIRFIVDKTAAPSGYLQLESSNMYSHGFAMLFLAEVYGTIPPYMELQPKVLRVLKKSVDLLERCQGPEGGWWYNPTKNNQGQGADISVTVCETNALRAARNGGIAVDKRVIQKALECVKVAQNSDGGFSYRVINGKGTGGSALPRSAGAVCILQALGAYDDPATQKGLEYLVKNTAATGFKNTSWPFYAAYYLSQAMLMGGDKYWTKWWPVVKKDLVSLQQADGSWAGEGGKGVGTGMALIVLQMPNHYLPIYQEGIEGNRPPSASE
jgi:hypothetical protein